MLALAAGIGIGAPASAGAKATAKLGSASLTVAGPKLSDVTEASAKVRVSGTVKLPSNLRDTAKNRNKVRVAVTLEDAKKKTQSFTTKIDRKRKYTATKATTLRGVLKIKAQTRVNGKSSGRAVTRTVTVKAAAKGPTGGPGAGTPGGGPVAPATQNAVPEAAQKLVGLFKLDEGKDYVDGRVEGSYFKMSTPNAAGFFTNGSSRAKNKDITLLRPGTDGGLRTDRYQPADEPLYGIDGEVTTDSVILPEVFFGKKFTVYTPPTSTNTEVGGAPVPVPLPEIYAKGGKISGQVTAWTANWSGSLTFNQGSPKPAGTDPYLGFTSPLTGTYDEASRHFTLQWKSQIQGGAFNNYGGFWFLEGTFVPAG